MRRDFCRPAAGGATEVVTVLGPGLPMPHRRTFAAALQGLPLTRSWLRFAIHGSAGRLRRLLGHGQPLPEHRSGKTVEAAGLPHPQVPGLDPVRFHWLEFEILAQPAIEIVHVGRPVKDGDLAPARLDLVGQHVGRRTVAIGDQG